MDFSDPDLGITNQALRIDSAANANEWYVAGGPIDEWAASARFRLVNFTPAGKENLLCLATHSTPLSPTPAITLVNGRYKLWSYVSSDIEILDLGPAVSNQWHTAYLYARQDGKVRLWWDGILRFDGSAPLVNRFDAYFEWGSGAWQYDAATTVDFDWVAYGNPCNLPQSLAISRAADRVMLSWPTNALGFNLQSSTNLTAGNWLKVTNTAAILGEQFTVTNDLAGRSKFFRLAQ